MEQRVQLAPSDLLESRDLPALTVLPEQEVQPDHLALQGKPEQLAKLVLKDQLEHKVQQVQLD